MLPITGTIGMSLPPIGRVPLPATVSPVASVPQAGFVVPSDAGGAPPAGVGAPSPIARAAPVGAALMLALQEDVTAGTGDREARQHAHQLLAALADLQRALLSGGGGDALQRLSLLAEQASQATDPTLRQVVASIRLRARLELGRAARALEGHPLRTG